MNKLYSPEDHRRRVLVTGCCGLIGWNLVKALCDYTGESFNVYGVDNMSGGSNHYEHKNFHFLREEVGSEDFVKLFNAIDPHIVYHLAAYAAEGLSPFIRKFNYTNNLVVTANVINCCIDSKQKPRLVFTSSMAVYGNKYEPPFHEELIPAPIDPYGIAKYACEMDIRVAGEQHNLDWCIIRPHNFMGVGQNIWDRYRNVIGIWMHQHLNGKPLTIFGSGTQLRAFSYVDDAMLPLIRAGISPLAYRQIINLGGTTFTSINGAAHMLISVMGGGVIEHVENRHEVHSAYSSWEKSVELLGFEDKTSLVDGMTQMWEWVKSNPERGNSRHWDECEITSGFYSFWK